MAQGVCGRAITPSYLSEEGDCIHRGNGSWRWMWDLLGSLHLGTAGDLQRLAVQTTMLQGLGCPLGCFLA